MPLTVDSITEIYGSAGYEGLRKALRKALRTALRTALMQARVELPSGSHTKALGQLLRTALESPLWR